MVVVMYTVIGVLEESLYRAKIYPPEGHLHFAKGN